MNKIIKYIKIIILMISIYNIINISKEKIIIPLQYRIEGITELHIKLLFIISYISFSVIIISIIILLLILLNKVYKDLFKE